VKGILADNNAEGHLDILLRVLLSDFWVEFRNELNVPVLTFDDLGLSRDVDDAFLWRTCQCEQVLWHWSNLRAVVDFRTMWLEQFRSDQAFSA